MVDFQASLSYQSQVSLVITSFSFRLTREEASDVEDMSVEDVGSVGLKKRGEERVSKHEQRAHEFCRLKRYRKSDLFIPLVWHMLAHQSLGLSTKAQI